LTKGTRAGVVRSPAVVDIFYSSDGNYVFINTFKMEMGQEEKRICKSTQMSLMEILFLLA
jgi:hypothetical protein